MSSEGSRERDAHRYYQTWLESTAGFQTTDHETAPKRFHLDGSSLRASNDTALIAFAQLGCLRLNAKRGIITLIGSSRQYILAEATRTLSLISDLTEDAKDDEIWFGNASIPRSQGMSEHALDPPEYTAVGPHGKRHTAKALVINDLTQDDRFSRHAFAGNGVTFYCGVPIVSQSGHPIGVYNVSDDKPRDGLTPAELIFLQDMSTIVMRHLETVKNDTARFRGEKMVLGLSNFLRGKSSAEHPAGDVPLTSPEPEMRPERRPTVDESEATRKFGELTITNADPNILRSAQLSQNSMKPPARQSTSYFPAGSRNAVPAREPERPAAASPGADNDIESPLPMGTPYLPASHASKPTEKGTSSRSEKMDQVFSRAATVLRECAAADGVVFFDAAPVSLATRSRGTDYEAHQDQSTGDSDSSQDGASDSHEYSSSGPSTDSEGSLDEQPRILRTKGQKCHMLGYALDISSPSTANANTIKSLGLTERGLRRFIRRYPRGKAFYFDAQGDFSVSEEDSADRPRGKTSSTNPVGKLEAATRLKPGSFSSKAIAEELIHVVPGARNVIWLPLWDFHKQRWCAGMFLWSRRPDRLLTAQDDMAYLKTFGSSIMIEVSRIDAQFADEAKSTFIANISHELRSPLHGILGSTEFLQETALDAFQSSMALNVETCAKTLLDTVEHVLDYAKINQRSAKFAQRTGSRGSDSSRSRSTLEDNLDLAELFEEAVEAVHAGGTFRGFQHAKDASPIAAAQSSPNDTLQATRDAIQRQSNQFSSAVRLVLKIEKQQNWWVRTQPGAIRRVIMNVLGNALKYTDSGSVVMSLVSSEEGPGDASRRKVCMTVKDTGRGMSANFLKDHAFTPFSQESQFSEGIGLGLSIVRQIVHSLAGRIHLTSTKGRGTELQVTLTLPVVASPPVRSGPDGILSAVMEKTGGMTMCVLDPTLEPSPPAEGPGSQESVPHNIRGLAETWFGMKTMRTSSMDGVTADFFVYAEPPPIDYLLNHHGEHSRNTEVPLIIMTTNAFESASLAANGINRLTDLGRVLEIISQPCGPRKFARTIHRCLTRLHTLAKTPGNFSTTDAATLDVHDAVPPASAHGGPQLSRSGESYMTQTESPQARLEKEIAGADHLPQPRSPSSELGPTVQQPGIERTSSRLVQNAARGGESDPKADPAMLSSSDGDQANPPILLVDDNEINLNLLVAFMKKARHPYVKAANGLEAVQAYEQSSADPKTAFKYVLMDISMPVMDGIEATRIIRQHEKKTGLPNPATIITLTGLSVEATRKDMMDAGADYFLSKPVKFKELIELLRP